MDAAAAMRVREYLRRSAQVLADEWSEDELGIALSTPSLPRVWVLNRLLVLDPPDGRFTSHELAERAIALTTGAGGSHARVSMLADGAEVDVVRGFAALGWGVTRNLIMLDSGSHRPGAAAAAELAPSVALDDLLDRAHADAFYGADAAAVAQLRELDRRSRARLGGRVFVAPPGDPAAMAELRELDGVGEIDFVQTLTGRRGEGLGRAVFDAALTASRRANELTFLEADAGDWPLRWYERLGFAAVGTAWELDLDLPGPR